ncbi:MAG TPA: copper resistance CopC family protein [Acetobacteraceae bacterium]|nr:copper resistance CopC family protein [Acetobacteraceae bacterium]
MIPRRTLSLALALLALPGPLRAHSELRGSVPAEGARLSASPAEIVLRFNERVQVTTLRLLDSAGRALPLRRVGGADPAPEARAAPSVPLGAGAYRVEWRAISADGHPIGGALRFSVEAAR